MSKMGELYLETQKESLAFDASMYEDENPDYQSRCCSSSPFGNSFDEEELTGICSKCYDGANFNDLNDEGE